MNAILPGSEDVQDVCVSEDSKNSQTTTYKVSDHHHHRDCACRKHRRAEIGMAGKRGRTLLYLDSEYQYRTPAQRSNADNQSGGGGGGASSSNTSAGLSPAADDEQDGKRPRRLQRACTFCRRSHLVCEETRPCQRCVKRGIAAQCEEDDRAQQQQQPTQPKQQRSRGASSASSDERARKRSAWQGKEHIPTPSRGDSGSNSGSANSTPSLRQQQLGSNIARAAATAHAAQQLSGDRGPHSYAPPSHPPPHHPSHALMVSGMPAQANSSGSVQHATQWDDPLFGSFFFDQDFSHDVLSAAAAAAGGTPTIPYAPLPGALGSGHQYAGHHSVPLANQQQQQQQQQQHQQHQQQQQQERQDNAEQYQSTPKVTVEQHSPDLSPTTVISDEAGVPRKRIKWFEPLPFRKGYASIVRHLQRNRWQPRNVESVQQALASVAQLWDAREDGMQFSDLLQVHAQWATCLTVYRDQVFPHSPVAMLACRKAGEIYAVSAAAMQLFKRPASDFEDGQLAVYQLMTEDSAAHFFRLYEQAIRCRTLTSSQGDGSSVTLHWDARLIVQGSGSSGGDGRSNDAGQTHAADNSSNTGLQKESQVTSIPTRGVFHIKFSELELPCLLILSFIPL